MSYEPLIAIGGQGEVGKLLEVGFIKPIEITYWVSPMVLVKKKNGKL